MPKEFWTIQHFRHESNYIIKSNSSKPKDITYVNHHATVMTSQNVIFLARNYMTKGRVKKKKMEFSNFSKNSAILLRMPWFSEKCNKIFLALCTPPPLLENSNFFFLNPSLSPTLIGNIVTHSKLKKTCLTLLWLTIYSILTTTLWYTDIFSTFHSNVFPYKSDDRSHFTFDGHRSSNSVMEDLNLKFKKGFQY